MPNKKATNVSRKERPSSNDDRSFFVGNIRQNISAQFGAAFKARRQLLGLTQSDIAAKTGISRSYISEVECGKENISLERAAMLARSVNAALRDLLSD